MFKRKYGKDDYLVINDRGRPKVQPVKLDCNGIGLTTTNPDLYEQHFGVKLDRWRDKGTSRPIKKDAKRGQANKGRTAKPATSHP